MIEPTAANEFEAGPTPGTIPHAVLAPDEILMPDEVL
jgi:hypothetical protein